MADIPNYQKPQSYLTQTLQTQETVVEAGFNAFIYGPQYRLSRYTNADERATTQVRANATGVLDAVLAADETFDGATVEVYAEGIRANVDAAIGDATTTGFQLSTLGEANTLIYYSALSTSTVGDVPAVDGRELQVGDKVLVTCDGSVVERTIVERRQLSGVNAVLVLDGAATLKYIEDSWPSVDEEALTVQLISYYSGKLPTTSFTITNTGVNFAALPSVPVAGTTAGTFISTTGIGQLYLSYRALVKPDAATPIRKIRNTSDINQYYGKIDPANILAFGLYTALQGSEGKVVYGAAVEADTQEAYIKLMRQSASNINLYIHAPLTYNFAVHTALNQHLATLSTPDQKRWRRGYVATPIADEYAVLTTAGAVDVEAAVDAGGLLTTNQPATDFITAGISAGNIVRASFTVVNDPTSYTRELEVLKVLGPKSLQVVAPGANISTGKIEIWSGTSAEAQVAFVRSRSQQLTNRRLINIWTDSALIQTEDGLQEVETLFLAAEIAGRRTAVPVHQGLTRSTLRSATQIPSMYVRYTEDHLNAIAAAGTFIITQDEQDGPVYVRHQLTTATDKGPLYYEDSVGVNFDEISYMIALLQDGYIGKYNAVEEAVRDLQNRINEQLEIRAKTVPGQENLGPQIVEYSPEYLKVEIDPVARDTINTLFEPAILPIPLNRIITQIVGQTSFTN